MQKLVIKIGTSTLTQGSAKLSRRTMLSLVEQCVHLHEKGKQLVLVSSGAVAAGREHLSIQERSSSAKQLCASTGQVILMQIWLELFSLFDLHVGQMLLARHDFSDLKKQNAAKETLASMLQHSIIPIINENDLWDNDNLAAVVAKLIQADTVILLTDQEGLYTADPRVDPRATLIAKVEHIDAEILSFATGASSSLGIGGMATKIEAAQAAAQFGIRTIIAPSYRPNVLIDLLEGKQIGTVFMEDKR